jgi:hypothetical protein
MPIRVRYKGEEQGLLVSLIHTWKRNEITAPTPEDTGKPYIRNRIWDLFDPDPEIDAISMVRANGPPFLILRKGVQYFDITRREVEVATRREHPQGEEH